ncbi:DUF3568 family protein [Desulfobacca acetoxidans]
MAKRCLKGIVGLILGLGLLVGCVETALLGVGASAALGGYKWIEGTMVRDYPRSLPEMWQACQTAVQHFRMKLTEKKYSPMTADISAVEQDGTEVKINLTAQPNNITTVGVRFGMMGNSEASQMFHTQLAKELGL